MKKAFLYAYDHVNLGDDLFIRTIANRYPKTRFYLWSDKKNRRIFQKSRNIKVIDKNSVFLKILEKLRPSLTVRYQEFRKKKSDAVVYIGGSIFMEYPTWKDIVNWWRNQVQKYPFYVLGANFGPYHTEEYRKAMEAVMDEMQDICFRDQYSYQLFGNIDKVRLAPDILFSYPMPKIKQKKKQIYISVINCEKKEDGKYREYRDEYENALCEIINSYLEEHYNVKIVSFCKDEGDEEAGQRLLERFKNHKEGERIAHLNYDGMNSDEVLEELASSEFVIATRFHAIILSLASGQRVYPIIYSGKSKNMLQDIGFTGNCIDLKHMEEFSLAKFKENMEKLHGTDVSEAIQDSENHFSQLDKVLR